MARQNTNSSYQQQKETLQHLNTTTIDLPWNDKNQHKIIENIEAMDVEEQHLSQKMSELLTSTTNEKEYLFEDIKMVIENIPDYLSKRNKSFQQIISQALSKTTTARTKLNDDNHKKKDLRKITILMYKIIIIRIYQRLWTAYLKSGIGQLIIPSKTKLPYSITVSIWPKEIKSMLPVSTNIDNTNENESCLKLVNDRLDELDHQLKHYQIELNMKVNSFQGYIPTIRTIIETYIEQNLHSLRMEIDHKIALFHFDYHIQALKLEYLRQNPNDQQKQIMKQICQQKYEQEITEQEYNFLKQQIAYYNLPSQSFESSPLAHCPLIDSVENPTIQQYLFQQYKQVAEQSRIKIFNLYLKTAEDQRVEYKNKYDTSMKEMWSNQRHTSADQSKVLSKIMINLLDERYKKIGERIQCIYKFKAIQFIESKSKL